MSISGRLKPTVKNMRIVAGSDSAQFLALPSFYNLATNSSFLSWFGKRRRHFQHSLISDPSDVPNFETSVSVRKVAKAFVYPSYVRTKSNHDIALLLLDEPFALYPVSKVNTICLPAPGEEIPLAEATISGWGQTTERGKQSFFLKSTNVSILKDK